VNRIRHWALLLFAVFSSELVIAVDETSSEYQTGSMIGKVFIAVLAILIIRKLFFKKG